MDNVSQAAATLGRRGAAKGGKAAWSRLSPEQRRERAASMGRASWAKLTPEQRSARARRSRATNSDLSLRN